MKIRYNSLCLVFLFFLLVSSVFTLIHGETPWKVVWTGVQERLSHQATKWNPLLDERLPRLIILICTGASLATSGAVMQSLFNNPLASPSILGINSGGCLAVILIFIYDLRYTHPYSLPLAAFIGCLMTLCIVYQLSKWQRDGPLTNLILTGIAISTLLTAFQGFLLYALRDHWQLIQMITEWETGTTIDRTWQQVHMQLPLTIIGLWGCVYYKEELNLLALGEEESANLGVNGSKVRWRLFLCISLLTAGALASVGMIAFFGLIIPHVIRQLQGPNHLTLISLCIIGGAASLTTLDVSLRILQLNNVSIGSFSALVGGCFFLFLLFHPKKSLRTNSC